MIEAPLLFNLCCTWNTCKKEEVGFDHTVVEAILTALTSLEEIAE